MPKPAISIEKLLKKKFIVMNFENEYKDLIGTPECSGSWLIYGGSGEGKTTFSLETLKYITRFKKCAYIPLEEGAKMTFQEAAKEANLRSASSRIKLWVDYTVEDLNNELVKPRSPEVIFIDSLQYLKMKSDSYNQLTAFEYKSLINSFPKKLFIFISHAKNNEPKGALAEAVYFGSDVCLFVKDFCVYPKKSRYGGKKSMHLKPSK